MSQLQISSYSRTFAMNVLAFKSPLYGTFNGTQIKSMAIWFPIKLSQPEVEFDVVFANETDYEDFQAWVRTQQLLASYSTQLVTLNWPERNIANWTGVIMKFEAGGKRFNVAPRSRFTVLLVDSLVTRRTTTASIPASWLGVAGYGSPAGLLGAISGAESSWAAWVAGQITSAQYTGGGPGSNILTGSG
jgi:hypothetical protein